MPLSPLCLLLMTSWSCPISLFYALPLPLTHSLLFKFPISLYFYWHLCCSPSHLLSLFHLLSCSPFLTPLSLSIPLWLIPRFLVLQLYLPLKPNDPCSSRKLYSCLEDIKKHIFIFSVCMNAHLRSLYLISQNPSTAIGIKIPGNIGNIYKILSLCVTLKWDLRVDKQINFKL